MSWTRSLAVFVPPAARRTGLGALLDLCELANRYTRSLYEALEQGTRALAIECLSLDGAPVNAMDGRVIAVEGRVDDRQHAAVFIASFEPLDAKDLQVRLATLAPLGPWLRRQYAGGAWIAAGGASVFALADAGLLAGGRVAPPWLMESTFRRRCPDVTPEFAQSVVAWERVLTAAGMDAEPALALRLLEATLSPNLGHVLSKITHLEATGLQDPLFYPQLMHADPMVGRAQHLLQQRFSGKVNLVELAADLGVSQRTLIRRFRASLGVTPLKFLQHVRIESAKRMLAKTGRPIERIGYMVGYGDAGHFKSLFRRQVGLTPAAFRRQALAAAAPASRATF